MLSDCLGITQLYKVERESLLCIFYIKLGVIRNGLQRGQPKEKLQFLLESNIKEGQRVRAAGT